MNAVPLKSAIRDAIWATAESLPYIASATLTGSFVDAPSLDGISDIDCIIVVDHLNAKRFAELQARFDEALRGLLAEAGFDFYLNATLGPLKFNAPRLAVLHLMVYSEAARIQHAHNSPFTCLDWQRSTTFSKKSLAEVYPVFGLQPRHFTGARRSIRDYLADLHSGTISYRELVCDDAGYQEKKLAKPMTLRDRHEFGYHVMRFLMSNLRKLITRKNDVPANDELSAEFFRWFPAGGDRFAPLFAELVRKKKSLDFTEEIVDLVPQLDAFARALEEQLRECFTDNATEHLFFRHAATRLNGGSGGQVIFQGHSDEPISITPDADWRAIATLIAAQRPEVVYSSPTLRTRQSLARIRALMPIPFEEIDSRIHELNYGELEGLSVQQARAQYPQVFAAWQNQGDPRLPGGESTADLELRLTDFLADLRSAPRALVATHNVVLRSLIGSLLNVPREEWFRLRVPHLVPVSLIHTRFGWFVNLPESHDRDFFQDYAPRPAVAA
ncbi:MAG: histidine phosphatase family protein [Gemmataceae bacterium]